jgi:hypothetical protein
VVDKKWDAGLLGTAEVCDALDNDLDGIVDNNLTDIPGDVYTCAEWWCEAGAWSLVVASGQCLIDGVCYDEGTRHPTDPNLACSPDLSPTEWSPWP